MDYDTLKLNEHKNIYYCKYHNMFYNISVGKNAKNNWELIDKASKEDIWFHLDDYPSCHVILSVDNNINKNIKPHISVIKKCARLCKNGSKLKDTRKVSVIYTKIKNIKKGNEVGSVYSKNVKTIKV